MLETLRFLAREIALGKANEELSEHRANCKVEGVRDDSSEN